MIMDQLLVQGECTKRKIPQKKISLQTIKKKKTECFYIINPGEI